MHKQDWGRLARHTLLAAGMAMGGMALAHAANPSMLRDFKFDHPTFVHKLPFAQYNLVLQISEANPALWNLTLNNAQNVLDYFGQDKARIVIVAYGPGLKVLLKNSPLAARIASEDAEGIEFDACHVTMEAMAKQLGHMPELVPQAVVVPGGVVRIMQLEKDGFAYLKP